MNKFFPLPELERKRSISDSSDIFNSPQSSRSPQLLSPILTPRRIYISTPQHRVSHVYTSSNGSNISAMAQSTNLLNELERLVRIKMARPMTTVIWDTDTISSGQIKDDISVLSGSSGATSNSSILEKHGYGTTTTIRPCLIDFKEELKRNEFPL